MGRYPPFEAIEIQFGVSETEVIKIMRKELENSAFKRWRKRVNSGVDISNNKISK